MINNGFVLLSEKANKLAEDGLGYREGLKAML